MAFDPFVAAELVIALAIGAVGAYFALEYRLKLIDAEHRRDERFFQNLKLQQRVWVSQEGRVFKNQYVTIEERLFYKHFPLTQWSSQKHLVNQELDATGLIQLARDVSQLAAEVALPVTTRIVQRLLSATKDNSPHEKSHEPQALEGRVYAENTSGVLQLDAAPSSREYGSAVASDRTASRAKPWLFAGFVILLSLGGLLVSLRYLKGLPGNEPQKADAHALVSAPIEAANPPQPVQQAPATVDNSGSNQELEAPESLAVQQPAAQPTETVPAIAQTYDPKHAVVIPQPTAASSAAMPASSEPTVRDVTNPSHIPEVIHLKAKHMHSMGSCEGTITLSVSWFEFMSSQHSIRVDRAETKLDGSGVRDRSGKKWHFRIAGRSDDETRTALSEWVSSGRLPSPAVVQGVGF
jgi:hypothetical protein